MTRLRQKRISEELSGILPPDELTRLDIRGAALRILRGNNGEFRSSDTAELIDGAKEEAELLGSMEPGKHILFKKLPAEYLDTTLVEEMRHWNIESNTPLDPNVSKAIIDLYEKLHKSPPDVHKLRDPLTMNGHLVGHSVRVGVYAALMAQKSLQNGAPHRIDPIIAGQAGFCHDLGKLEEQQRRLVRERGRFNDEQREQIKMHPLHGAAAIDMLARYNKGRHLPISDKILHDVWQATAFHHVRPDNDKSKSYPNSIPPTEVIPLARAIAVADAFDAMTTRDYDGKGPTTMEEKTNHAYNEIRACAGTQFDPDMVNLFLRVRPKPMIYKYMR